MITVLYKLLLKFNSVHGDCISFAVKERCKNTVERRHRRRNFDRRCDINFLPLVVVAVNGGEAASRSGAAGVPPPPSQHHHHRHRQQQQLLTCRSNIPGFAACPSSSSSPVRAAAAAAAASNNETAVGCNPLRENTKRCETARETVSATGCRVYETCDHALLIAGGWNRWTLRAHHRDNVGAVHRMLREHGFRADNVKVFFANGVVGRDLVSESDGKETSTVSRS